MKKTLLERRSELVGMPFGKASHQLKMSLLFYLADKCGMLNCYQCGERIESLGTFSVEHKQPWMSAADPRDAFFGLWNIAFSHRVCNYSKATPGRIHALKTHCRQGHEFTPANTFQRRCRSGKRSGRGCRQCKRDQDARRDRVRTARGAAISSAMREAQALKAAGHPVHGFRSTYNKGCRCEACRESNRLYRIDLFNRKRASGELGITSAPIRGAQGAGGSYTPAGQGAIP